MKLFIALLSVVIKCCLSEDYKLTIAHVNDVHARFVQTNKYSSRCTEKDEADNKCYGGFARIRTAVDRLREAEDNVLFLSGGDYYQGTVWYTLLKWEVMSVMVNTLGHDAMALGNHEFDDGIEGLTPFLKQATFPVLAANIDHTNEPSMAGLYKKSVVVEKGGRKVGIIGYLTTETLMIASPGKLKITDEVAAVKAEANRLKAEGVDIIIAVGHAGYSKDQDVARDVEHVDVVVGGHSNTFLYNGATPHDDKATGPYPKVVTQPSGKKVPVVQAYAFGKYLGVLNVTFDEQGNVIEFEGNPILLDHTVPQDSTVLKALEPYKEEVASKVQEEVGETYVFLDGRRDSCRLKECNLGNLMTDAIVHINTKYPDDLHWARTSIAIVNGGAIRASIEEQTTNGTITLEDVMTVAPFQSTVDIVELKGKYLKEVFEFSVSDYNTEGDLPGKFLQVSGINVVYDLSKPNGQRVARLQVRCVKCRVPRMEDVKFNETYKVATTSFLANGGDSYTMIRDKKSNHHLTGSLDTDVLLEYIKTFSPLYIGLENRIQFINGDQQCFDPLSGPWHDFRDRTTFREPDESTKEVDTSISDIISAHDIINKFNLPVNQGNTFLGSPIRNIHPVQPLFSPFPPQHGFHPINPLLVSSLGTPVFQHNPVMGLIPINSQSSVFVKTDDISKPDRSSVSFDGVIKFNPFENSERFSKIKEEPNTQHFPQEQIKQNVNDAQKSKVNLDSESSFIENSRLRDTNFNPALGTQLFRAPVPFLSHFSIGSPSMDRSRIFIGKKAI